ncbi:hypothetical protein RF644_03810 [Kocuria sp. CPCC 205258]|uniref:hypothetical protein n=1 Tax=Kocuria sp. CPCC 205258 TaxID=3073552 RepID=UPI0034D3D963
MNLAWLGIPLSDWADIGTVVATGLGVLAIVFAVVSIFQARHLQKEAAKPYVTVTMEPNSNMPELLELVVKNYGATAAKNVRMSFDPPLQRSAWDGEKESQDVITPRLIPVLAPGQDWRTTWDVGFLRNKAKPSLPDMYEAEICWEGYGKKFGWKCVVQRYVLDWTPHFDRRVLVVKTAHHAAKDLEEIKRLLKRPLPLRTPVPVTHIPLATEPAESREEEQKRLAAEARYLKHQQESGNWPDLGSL